MKNSARILIVEDKPDDERRGLHELINQKYGDKLELITDGQRAWDRLSDPNEEAGELVAVMMDLNLTTLGGLELLRRIRAHPHLRRLHVVVMTDETTSEDMARCIELGVTSFVKKPVTLASFTKAIADSFHGSRTAQKTIRAN